jgi:pilus assembly protein CpaC
MKNNLTPLTGTGSRQPCGQRPLARHMALAAVCALGALAGPVLAQAPAAPKSAARPVVAVAPPPTSGAPVTALGTTMELIIGKSSIMRLGTPNVADVSLISPTELYLLGKNYGSTNMLVWRKGQPAQAVDVNVSIDAERMEKLMREMLPNEKGIHVRPAADSVILTGVVSSAIKARYAQDIAEAFVRDINKTLSVPVVAGDSKAKSGSVLAISSTEAGGGTGAAKVVNLLQVMLDVKVAEVSRTLLDKLGAGLNVAGGTGMTYSILSNLLSLGGGNFSITSSNGNKLVLDAEKKDGLIKILAEPNIIAISGQEGSFLAGGKIFIPVSRDTNGLGGATITLEEKEFGVGLKFTPTVLEEGRIHLKVAPEVSELSQTGSPFTTLNGTTSVLPSFSTRRVQTTVQLMDGQSLAIAGLIKNNVTETVKRFPLLGEIPVLGALFRSSEFQNDRTELVFLITPHLIKPLNGKQLLPTDSFVPPERAEFFLGGKMEGTDKSSAPEAAPAVK